MGSAVQDIEPEEKDDEAKAAYVNRALRSEEYFPAGLDYLESVLAMYA